MSDYSPLHKGHSYTRTAGANIVGGRLSSPPAPAASSNPPPSHMPRSASHHSTQPPAIRSGSRSAACNASSASGVITAGQNVEPASTGRVAAHTNGTNDFNIYGLALTSVTDGQLVEVRPRI